jgi:hypothetical protein
MQLFACPKHPLRVLTYLGLFGNSLILIACDPLFHFNGLITTPYESPQFSGNVTSRNSNVLPGVTVKLYEHRTFFLVPLSPQLLYTATSDSNGKFDMLFIGGVPSRSGFFIQLSKLGYLSKEIDLSNDVDQADLEIRSCNTAWVCVEIFAQMVLEP